MKEHEIMVLTTVAYNPKIISREISQKSGIPQSSVIRILSGNKSHPYHISLCQELSDNDSRNRISFCKWMLQKFQENNHFSQNVLFGKFINYGEVNGHNLPYLSKGNPK